MQRGVGEKRELDRVRGVPYLDSMNSVSTAVKVVCKGAAHAVFRCLSAKSLGDSTLRLVNNL